MQGLMMDYPLTLDRIVEHGNRLYGHKTVATKLPDGSWHRYTYAELYRRTKRLANALEGLGVEPGDRVGTFSWNNYQHLELYYAVPGCGAVCHTLNIRLSAEQLAFIINHAEDKVVFVDATLLPLFEAVVDQVGCVEHFVLFNGDGAATGLPRTMLYEDLIEGASDDYQWAVDDENRAMGLCYTSGTTGDPKGALYSHRSMYLHTLGESHANAIGVCERDVVLPVVPQFHAMAWGLPYSCVFAGAAMVMPGPHLQPEALADTIAEEGVTIAAGVPTIWIGLYQELKARPRDLSCLRHLVVGGSAMPRALIEAFEKELGIDVLHAWGMTEMSPLGTICRLQRGHGDLSDAAQWDIKARQGYPIAGVEMRLLDDAGAQVPWDGQSMGEVQVRGPWTAKSYFKREPSADNFTADGWFRTGDVATMSPEGYMQITDRTKDLIKSGGEWISSIELENALVGHEGVLEAAVVAVADDKWGERPLAAVVLAEGADTLEEAELRAYLEGSFPRYWLPDTFIFVDDLPKTSVGKLDKKRIRQLHGAGELG